MNPPQIKHGEFFVKNQAQDFDYKQKRELILSKVQKILDSRVTKITKNKLAEKIGITLPEYCYYTRDDTNIKKQKENSAKYKKRRESAPFYFLISKIERFKKRSIVNTPFDFNDVIKKFGENPVCYLTGLPIDYNKAETYQLDHYIPVNKGGSGDLDNMRLAHPMANEMKRDYNLNEFVEICSLIAARKEILLNPEKM